MGLGNLLLRPVLGSFIALRRSLQASQLASMWSRLVRVLTAREEKGDRFIGVIDADAAFCPVWAKWFEKS